MGGVDSVTAKPGATVPYIGEAFENGYPEEDTENGSGAYY